MKSGCVSDSTRAAGRRLAEAYQTALANFGSQARQPSPVPLFARKWFLTPFPPQQYRIAAVGNLKAFHVRALIRQGEGRIRLAPCKQKKGRAETGMLS